MPCKKNRILFVVEAMGGGLFSYVVDLANELVDTYDMYIAYATREQTPENFREYFDERIHLIEVKNFVRSINFIKDLKAFFEIKKIAKDIRPDIIHLHSSKAGALGRWAFNGKNESLFYTPHGYSFLMKDSGIAKRIVYKSIEYICGQRNCTTISCSEGENNESIKVAKRTAYVNNGINTKKLQEVLNSARTEEAVPFTVFTIGRICYQKNPNLFNEIALKMPDTNFVWIGDGELRDMLFAPNIEITGWCERQEALRIALRGDVFILTSLWEGLPISLLEAMYMKKVCIVSDVIGNHDVIHTGENGFVCSDTDDFVNAIKTAQKSDLDSMTDNAHSEIINIYNTVTMAEEYRKLYDKAVIEHRKKKACSCEQENQGC